MEKLNQKFTIDQAMEFAIALAGKGLGFVEPNPAVGCVILDSDSKLIGYGYHEKFGGAHAEVNALKSVKDKDKITGSTVIVTLEPCGHTGKTPPCKQALIDAKIGKLVYGLSDPNPLFDDSGFVDMKRNNISIEKFNLSKKVELSLNSLVEKFIYSQKSNKTFISLKMGSSLDGQIALRNKESKWITNEKSRDYAHFLRATHEATLIGVGTLLDDNPSLNIRLEKFSFKKNKVIILDPKFRAKSFLNNSKLVKMIGQKNIYLATNNEDKVVAEGFNHIQISLNSHGQISLDELTKTLKAMNINSVLVEGGAATISEFLKQKVFNRLYTFIAPSIIGSGYGLSWTKGLSCHDLREKIQLDSPEIKPLDGDVLLSYVPKK